MSEIYPSVRTSIRNSVLQALYERPGAWLSTHDLLALVDEAESSEVLARILSDMAATGRLAKGAKTQNAKGQACNTWGLSPAWRGRLAVENTWQDHTGQAAAEAPPLPVESREDEAPIPPAPGGYTLPADKLGSTNTPASPRCTTQDIPSWHLAQPDQPIETPQTPDLGHWKKWAGNQPQVAVLNAEPDVPISALEALPPPRTPEPPRPSSAINEYQALQPPFAWMIAEPDQPIETPPALAPPSPIWADASAAVAAALTTPAMQETEIICAHLPVRWLPDLRLRLLGYDDRGDPVITLRVNTDGHGAYLTLSTHGQIPFDPGELDFLPSVGNALCQFIDALYPYGTTRPAAAATTPSAPEAQP